MKQRYTVITVITFLFCGILNAQIPLQWGARYNAPPDMADEARDIVVDAAGNAYVTGSGFNTGGNLDVITIKYDVNGNQMWVRNYDRGASANDEGKSIALDPSGNVYVTGYSTGATTGGDAVTIKYDNAGTQQWVMFYDGTNNQDDARAIAVDAAGNSYICGYTSDSLYFFNTLTICYNTAGTQQWVQTYDGPISGNDELLDIVIDGSSNVYVTGNTEGAAIDYNVLIIKYNSSGAQQWLQTHAGPSGGDYGKAIALDQSNNVLVGAQSGVSGNWFDYLIMKYSNAGTQLWASTYNNGNPGSNRYEDLWEIATDNAGYVYVTGQSQATGNNSTPPDMATLKFTPAGSQVWVRRYDGGFSNADDRAYAMVLDDTANVYIAGYSKNATNNDFMTIKYDSSGTLEFALRFNSQYNGIDQINAIALNSGDIYVTGVSANAANTDYLTIKYSYDAVGVNEHASAISHMQVYPNPSSDIINVQLDASLQENCTILIADISGRVVLQTTMSTGIQNQQINIAELAQGTYTLSCFSAENSLLATQLIIKN